jgi:DNA-binding NtrC family response regulator
MKSQKKILVVDDDISMGEMILEILTPEYEDVIYCSSPIEAKTLVSKKVFDLIITDVMMPELKGSDFIKLIRSLGRIEPFVFLTGSATKEVILSALRLGAIDLIEKPFAQQDFLKSIQRVLELEKRKLHLYESLFSKQEMKNSIIDQKRMIGLLHVVSEKK